MSKTTRFGVIGGGIRGTMFGEVIREAPNAELVAFCDPSPTAKETLEPRFSVPVTRELDELFAFGLDGVVISTPDFAHLDAGLAALNQNLHVMFEKPLATTREDAERLHQAASASTGKVMIGFENRWNTKFQQARTMLQDSGQPLVAQRVLLQDTEFVPRQMLSWSEKSTPGWFLFPHSLDLAMWISNARPVEVFARGVKKILTSSGIDTYDRISASFQMSDGSILDLDSGWVLPESRPAVFQFRYEIEAQALELELEIDKSGLTSYDKKSVAYVGDADRNSRGRLIGAPIDMMRDFIDLCAGADIDVPTIDQGLFVTQAIAAVHESLESKHNVIIG